MESPEIIVGLDIGTTKVAAIVGKRNEYDKIEILGVGSTPSVGVMRGSIANIDETVKAIKTVIDDVSQKAGVEISEVYVGIAGQHIKSLQHSGSRMRKNKDEEISQEEIDALVEDMYKLAMQPGEEIIHVIPQEYTIDDEPGIKKPIGMCGSCLQANFHIIVGHVTSAKNIHKCVQKAGLSVAGLILEPLASADSVLTEEEREAGVVLVDMGGGTTDVAIFQDNIIRHTSVIPFGGNVITEDIKEGCTIIKRQAEALKIKFGSAVASENSDEEIVSIPGLRGRHPKEISLKNLASIIQARVEEIIERVYYEIVNSGYEKKLITGIVLTGGGALLKHITQLTEFITGMDTRIGYPNEHLAKGVHEDIASPMYATGVGLVIKGFENYTPEKPTVEKVQQSKTKPKRENPFIQGIAEFFNENRDKIK
jgi:cell division protein FtsA